MPFATDSSRNDSTRLLSAGYDTAGTILKSTPPSLLIRSFLP